MQEGSILGVRIFALAKELEMPSKELIKYLQTQGHQVTSHMSSIPNPVANILRDRLKPKPRPSRDPKPPRAAKGKASAPANGDSSVKAPAAAATGTATSSKVKQTTTREAKRPKSASRAPSIGSEFGGGKSAEDGEGARAGKGKRSSAKPPAKAPRRHVRIFVQEVRDHGPSYLSSGRRRTHNRRGRSVGRTAAPIARPESVEVVLPISVKDFSALTTIRVKEILKTLINHGHMVGINASLPEEQATLVCLEFNIDVSFKEKEAGMDEFLKSLEKDSGDETNLVTRAPIVTFMGHVDHGKTSLLDRIRKTSVTAKEAGGITQHLGAYRVDKGNAHVVFIDTPGHQAFTGMRARGANVTDVAVLVVAADDGVKPQTEEAYNHAQAANVPIVVALNKIDKENANAMRCLQQISEMGLQPVEWSGETEVVKVSAMTGQGIDDLLETLSLTAEILELKANPGRPALGVVLEATATKHRGVVATALIQDGTLRKGDYVLSGVAHGRIRGLWINGTQKVQEAGPSTPVQITGLNAAPEAGEKLYVLEDAQKAKEIAEERVRRLRDRTQAARQKAPVTLESLFAQLAKEGSCQELSLILKADVRGSEETLRVSLENLSTEEIQVHILHSGVGAVTQDDVSLADASGAIVIAFQVGTDPRARTLAADRGVEIRSYQVIYEAIDDVRAAMESRLAPEHEEQMRGMAEIRQVYRASRVGNIAGCMVTSGTISRSDKVRLLRDGKVVHTGEINSLRRFKDDAKEVKEGFECGIKIAKFDDIKEGDVIESFVLIEKRRTI